MNNIFGRNLEITTLSKYNTIIVNYCNYYQCSFNAFLIVYINGSV
jgi:hypothetical protein